MTMKAAASEVAENFDWFADYALTEPVSIYKDGSPHLVLLSADEYRRLKRRDRQVYRAHEVPDDVASAIAATEPPADGWESNKK